MGAIAIEVDGSTIFERDNALTAKKCIRSFAIFEVDTLAVAHMTIFIATWMFCLSDRIFHKELLI